MTLLKIIAIMISIETPDCQCSSATHCYCVGDKGMSHGCLQISEAYLIDANEYLGTDYKFPTDCYDRAKAAHMVEGYMGRYARHSRLNREPTVEDIVRIHNGGPDGWEQDCTLKHWDKWKNSAKNLN